MSGVNERRQDTTGGTPIDLSQMYTPLNKIPNVSYYILNIYICEYPQSKARDLPENFSMLDAALCSSLPYQKNAMISQSL
jgi:hypothetical protein